MSGGKKKSCSSTKDESPSLDFLTSGSSGLGRRPGKKTPGSSERLPSVRPKRDLTLGGVAKKSFTPTIPTSRRVKKESEATPEVTPRRKGREERRDKKDRGKRRGKEIIASASVFSMGPADRGPGRSRGPSFGGGGGTQGGGGDDIRFAKKPDFLSDKSLKSEYSKADEEADPIQGSSIDELFSSSEHPPTLLPLDYQLHTKARVVVPKQVKVVKDEPMDYSDAAEVESMDTESSLPAKAVLAPPTKVEVHQAKISDLFTPQDPAKGQFLFLQLPDCLPTNRSLTSESEELPHQTNGAISMDKGKKSTEMGEEADKRHCSLRDLPEGLIGKLKVHKSGKVRLTLGEVSFDVAMGTPCGFLQELACVRKEGPDPKLTVLGQLSHRLVCTPDFESILEQSEHR